MNTERDLLTERVIGLAIEVHRILGPGFQEHVYESALHYELKLARIECRRQVEIAVTYKNEPMGIGFRVDLLVERTLPIELKAVDRLSELHRAQLISYLNLLQLKRDLRVSFVVFQSLEDLHKKSCTAVFPRAGLVIMHTDTLLACSLGNMINQSCLICVQRQLIGL